MAARMWQAVVALGLTEKPQGEIAKAFGVSQSVISGWKNGQGNVALDTAIEAQAKHRVRAAYVLFGEGALFVDGDEEAARLSTWEAGRASAFREIAAVARRLAISPAEALKVKAVPGVIESVMPHAPAAPEAKRRHRAR